MKWRRKSRKKGIRIINDLLERLEEMKIQITKYEIDKKEAFENKEKLAKFYNKWIINLDQEYNEY